MRSLQDEIRQAQRELTCPICSRSFQLEDIRLRTFANSSAVELSVVCSHGHFPVILIVPVTLRDISKAGRISRGELQRAYEKIDRLSLSIEELYKIS
jgi:hypothetical protein